MVGRSRWSASREVCYLSLPPKSGIEKTSQMILYRSYYLNLVTPISHSNIRKADLLALDIHLLVVAVVANEEILLKLGADSVVLKNI